MGTVSGWLVGDGRIVYLAFSSTRPPTPVSSSPLPNPSSPNQSLSVNTHDSLLSKKIYLHLYLTTTSHAYVIRLYMIANGFILYLVVYDKGYMVPVVCCCSFMDKEKFWICLKSAIRVFRLNWS